jgi:hypothetical protein
MILVVCDKCRKEIRRLDWSLVKFPYIKIEKVYDMTMKTTYNLCCDCQEKLEKWLRNEDNAE